MKYFSTAIAVCIIGLLATVNAVAQLGKTWTKTDKEMYDARTKEADRQRKEAEAEKRRRDRNTEPTPTAQKTVEIKTKKTEEKKETLTPSLFASNMVEIYANGKYGFADRKTGEIIIPVIYEATRYGFHENCVKLKLNGKWGFVDDKNNIVVPFKYDEVYYFYKGVAQVVLKGKMGKVNKQGNVVIPIKYDQLGTDFNNMLVIKLKGKWGLIDLTGKDIVPPTYDTLFYDIINRRYEGRLKDKIIYLDMTGKKITDAPAAGINIFRRSPNRIPAPIAGNKVSSYRKQPITFVVP